MEERGGGSHSDQGIEQEGCPPSECLEDQFKLFDILSMLDSILWESENESEVKFYYERARARAHTWQGHAPVDALIDSLGDNFEWQDVFDVHQRVTSLIDPEIRNKWITMLPFERIDWALNTLGQENPFAAVQGSIQTLSSSFQRMGESMVHAVREFSSIMQYMVEENAMDGEGTVYTHTWTPIERDEE